ncbi:MAG TPA: hypothetical protein VLI05_05665 [Candidatus Saccharimonadia bacterium]|nr:hypothetical protein [Candidatus Saccharimonadia bacterium]
MKTYLLYNRQTPGEGQMQELARRLEPLQVETELLDADSPRGVQLAEHYDVLARPAVLLLRDDGSPVQLWAGDDQLPAPTDISYLAHQ